LQRDVSGKSQPEKAYWPAVARLRLRSLKCARLPPSSESVFGYPIRIGSRLMAPNEQEMPLGRLRDVLTVTPGQRVAYIADAADTAANRKAIIGLVQNADLLFIEAAFAASDAPLAAERAHLTTDAAGQIGRKAGVRRIEPFHFSPRYAGEEERMLDEVMAAFADRSSEGIRS
jgi:ribonuclease Z